MIDGQVQLLRVQQRRIDFLLLVHCGAGMRTEERVVAPEDELPVAVEGEDVVPNGVIVSVVADPGTLGSRRRRLAAELARALHTEGDTLLIADADVMLHRAAFAFAELDPGRTPR